MATRALSCNVYNRSIHAGKKFSPDGSWVSVGQFKSIFRKSRGRILYSINKLERNGIIDKFNFGKSGILEVSSLADCLYKSAIHPRFFAETLYVMAEHAALLSPCMKAVRLKMMSEPNLKKARDDKKIDTRMLLGIDFKTFAHTPPQKKPEILVDLGILVLKNNAALPNIPEIDPLAEYLPPPPTDDDMFCPE